jgi:S-adenosylmethionine:tRNA ribosyltransferase-isomerase
MTAVRDMLPPCKTPMRTDELNFDLPAELIAQHPVPNRSESRLLHHVRATGSITHRRFAELPELLRAGDLLVMNNARVTPARFDLVKETGGVIEALYLDEPQPGLWEVMLKNAGSKAGLAMTFARQPGLTARLQEVLGEGVYRIQVTGTSGPAVDVLEGLGRMPLPPYIRRDKGDAGDNPQDRQRYQTVYAQVPGSVAAPTAGLHFTDAVLHELDTRGIQRCMITLHVGMGTFKPVTAETLDGHTMHEERYEISAGAAGMISKAAAEGRRVVAVGTTSVRVLESLSGPPAEVVPHVGRTSIFIRPGYAWKRVGALITNFHLPKSTLVALVASWTGHDAQKRIYAEAIARRYRFFSYGDSSFLE